MVVALNVIKLASFVMGQVKLYIIIFKLLINLLMIGFLQCDYCAPKYSNKTTGYCQPCCSKLNENSFNITDEKALAQNQFLLHNCVDCSENEVLSKLNKFGTNSYTNEQSSMTVWHLILTIIVLFAIIAACMYCCIRWSNGETLLLRSSNTCGSTNME